MDQTTRDTHVFVAKLAEQAERYDGMFPFFSPFRSSPNFIRVNRQEMT